MTCDLYSVVFATRIALNLVDTFLAGQPRSCWPSFSPFVLAHGRRLFLSPAAGMSSIFLSLFKNVRPPADLPFIHHRIIVPPGLLAERTITGRPAIVEIEAFFTRGVIAEHQVYSFAAPI